MLEQPYLQRAAVIVGIVLAVTTALTTVQARRLNARLAAANAELEQLRTTTAPKSGQHGDEVATLRRQLQQEKERYSRLQARKSVAAETATTAAGSVPESAALATTTAGGGAPPTFADFQARMAMRIEQMKKDDPERYQRMVQARQDRQKATEQALTEQVTSLAQRAQASSNPKEADIITQVATTLDQINQLRQSRSELRDLPPEQQQVQAQQIGDQLQQAYKTLDTLRQQDRAVQMENLAVKLGVTGSNIQAMADGVKAINQNTQYNVGGDHQHGRGNGGGH